MISALEVHSDFAPGGTFIVPRKKSLLHDSRSQAEKKKKYQPPEC